jgi:hypothetical protein
VFQEQTLSIQDKFCPGQESNPQPSTYKVDLLPSKLTRLAFKLSSK